MRENDLTGRMRRRFRWTTDSKHNLPVAENLLQRDFDPEAPNRGWAAGISYVQTLFEGASDEQALDVGILDSILLIMTVDVPCSACSVITAFPKTGLWIDLGAAAASERCCRTSR
jgi:hypothetical protein